MSTEEQPPSIQLTHLPAALETGSGTVLEWLVDRTLHHMREGGFPKRYADMHTAAEAAAYSEIRTTLRSEARRRACAKVQNLAAIVLDIDPAEGRELGQLWHLSAEMMGNTAVGEFLKLPPVAVEHAESAPQTIKAFWLDHYLGGLNNEPANAAELQRTAKVLTETHARVTQSVEALLDELDLRKRDPELVEALDAWTNSPDSQGDIGADKYGWHAGLIHFFEYQGHPLKARRFKYIEESMTVAEFINFSKRLSVHVAESIALLQDPSIETENHVTIFEDSSRDRRYYILQPNGELIICFQKPGQGVKLTTMIPRIDIEYLHKISDECLDGHDRGQLNKLGPYATFIGGSPSMRAKYEKPRTSC